MSKGRKWLMLDFLNRNHNFKNNCWTLQAVESKFSSFDRVICKLGHKYLYNCFLTSIKLYFLMLLVAFFPSHYIPNTRKNDHIRLFFSSYSDLFLEKKLNSNSIPQSSNAPCDEMYSDHKKTVNHEIKKISVHGEKEKLRFRSRMSLYLVISK
jgi:hypothetical protein